MQSCLPLNITNNSTHIIVTSSCQLNSHIKNPIPPDNFMAHHFILFVVIFLSFPDIQTYSSLPFPSINYLYFLPKTLNELSLFIIHLSFSTFVPYCPFPIYPHSFDKKTHTHKYFHTITQNALSYYPSISIFSFTSPASHFLSPSLA